MSRLVINRDGGKTDEYGTFTVHQRAFLGEVVEGLVVTQDSPSVSMNVRVQPGTIRIPTGSAPSNYYYECILDTAMPGELVTMPASQSNPFWVYIVAYVDKSVTPNKTSVTNNSNDMFKFKAVSGTPASTPNRPSTAQITAANTSATVGGVGSTNPYSVIAEVFVDANATQIVSGKIGDKRSIITYLGKIDRPHYGALAYSNVDAGQGIGQVFSSQVPMAFNNADTDNTYGITTTLGNLAAPSRNGGYLTVARDGLYQIFLQIRFTDFSGTFPKTAISWINFSADNGANWFLLRNRDVSVAGMDGSIVSWAITKRLTANTRVGADFYVNPAALRVGNVAVSSSVSDYQSKFLYGSHLSLTEIR